LFNTAKMRISSYWWDATQMRNTLPGVAPIVMVEEEPLLNFSTLLTWRSSTGAVYAQGCADEICLLAVEKFPNTISGLVQ